jgi:hypothetical protein
MGTIYDNFVDTSIVTINKNTAGYNLTIQTDSTCRPSTSTWWNGAYYTLAPDVDGTCIYITGSLTTNVIIDGLQIYPLGASAASTAVLMESASSTVRNCRVNLHTSINNTGILLTNVAQYVYRNFIFGGRKDFGAGIAHNGVGKAYIYNNSICDGMGSYFYGIRERSAAANAADVINNAVFNCNYNFDADNSTWGSNSGYNATNSATAPGSNNQVSKNSYANFTSSVTGKVDMKLLSTANCVNTGTTLIVGTLGIFGNAITDTWDIGADEYVSAEPPAGGSRPKTTHVFGCFED